MTICRLYLLVVQFLMLLVIKIKRQVLVSLLPNASDFTWETVVTKNIGLDLGLLNNNRLNMTADIYVRDTKDMLMASKDLPNVYGASSPKTNAANLRTKGWEASISWNDSFNLKGKAFHYSVVLGLADNTTKVTKYNNDNKTLGTPYERTTTGRDLGICC